MLFYFSLGERQIAFWNQRMPFQNKSIQPMPLSQISTSVLEIYILLLFENCIQYKLNEKTFKKHNEREVERCPQIMS